MKVEYSDVSDAYLVTRDNGDESILSSDDEDDAQRELALRVCLDDWTSKMDVMMDRVEVNPHRKSNGVSPEEAQALVAFVRERLAEIKTITMSAGQGTLSMPDLHLMTLAQLKPFGYHALTMAAKQWCNQYERDGHKLVNAIYTLIDWTPSGAQEESYVFTVREAWEGGEIKDRRTWYETNSGEYLVVTDEEADKAWDENLESYIDDCMEIPDHVKPYFDREAWKKDARMDGRGHCLSGYDLSERQVEVLSLSHDDQRTMTTYYIYRQN